MKYLILVPRYLLGAMFLVFGLNFFLKFIPLPNEYPEQAQAFLGAIAGSGFLATVKVLEIVGGLMLISGFFIPLGLTILGPIIVNITFFHIFLVGKVDPGGLVPLALLLVCIGGYWSYFRSVFTLQARTCCG